MTSAQSSAPPPSPPTTATAHTSEPPISVSISDSEEPGAEDEETRNRLESDEAPPETQTDVFTGALPRGRGEETATDVLRPERPRDVWFRSSKDDVTMSAVSQRVMGDLREPSTHADAGDEAVPGEGVFTSAPHDLGTVTSMRSMEDAGSMTDAGTEDLGATNEVAAFDDDMLEQTAARPHDRHDTSGQPNTSVTDVAARSPADESLEAIVVDDLADIIEVEDQVTQVRDEGTDRTPKSEETPKRRPSSVPPPLPRG